MRDRAPHVLRNVAGWLPKALVYVVGIVLSLWVLAPLYVITLAAFSSEEDVYDYPKQLLPKDLSTGTMRFFLDFPGMTDALWRSVIVAAATLAISLAIGTPAGYALARFAFRGADTVRLSVVATRAFPIVILSIPLAVIFIRWGIDDSIQGVSIAHTALALPFVVLTTASVFAGVPAELEEAAMTLGCSRASAFVRVALPLALPGLAASAIFVFIISWNEVFAASLLTLQNRTLPAAVLSTLEGAPLNFRFAGGFFLLAPSVLVILVIRRYLFTIWGRVVR
jgi:multiple sugar transport system permease protein